jgi:hypothetical protein
MRFRASATAALRAAGYRVVRGCSEHYRTIEALEFSIDAHLRRAPDAAAYQLYRAAQEWDLVDPILIQSGVLLERGIASAM